MSDKWWEVTKVKKELANMDLCCCKALIRGKWVIIDKETRERAYVCLRCGKRVYPNTK